MKEDIFSKFKDYNNELEKILENKDFSKDSKNLLLSMFYKLETSYSDYETVKRNVKTKQEYLENILENIKYCNSIVLIKPNTEEFEEFKNENKIFDVDLKLRKIRVIDNELDLLSSILELNNFKIYLDERYNLIRNSFPYILNTGNDMDNTEVLRDFNAFSWNINAKEIENIYVKLIYENLKFALSQNLIKKIEESSADFDLIKFIREDLEENNDKKTVDDFLNIIFKLSIIIYIEQSKIERKRLSEEYEVIEEDLETIKNKKEYINKIIDRKIELNKKIKSLDLILNNDELLVKEFNERNDNELYNKIFNIKNFEEKLKRDRDRTLQKIEESNKKLDPKQYIEDKNRIQDDYKLLKDINFEENADNKKILFKELKNLQKIFIEKIIPKKIEKLDTKEELINLLYQIRYYNFIPYDKEKAVYEEIELRKLSENVAEILLNKFYNLKIINTISTNKVNDINIIKQILFTKIINLEEIYIEIIKEEKTYKIYIYDDKDTLEVIQEIELEFNKKDRIKLKKQIKLFK